MKFCKWHIQRIIIFEIPNLLLSFDRVLSVDSHNIEALKYKTLYALCRQGNYDDAAQALRDLYSEMDRSEPNNASLFVHMAQLFSRIVSMSFRELDKSIF